MILCLLNRLKNLILKYRAAKCNYKENAYDCMYCISITIKIKIFCTKILIQVDKYNHNCYN